MLEMTIPYLQSLPLLSARDVSHVRFPFLCSSLRERHFLHIKSYTKLETTSRNDSHGIYRVKEAVLHRGKLTKNGYITV